MILKLLNAPYCQAELGILILYCNPLNNLANFLMCFLVEEFANVSTD